MMRQKPQTPASWHPAKGERCVITSVTHPAFEAEIGLEVTFLRHVPFSRWVWVDVNRRSSRERADGVRVTRIYKAEKVYRIEQLSPLGHA